MQLPRTQLSAFLSLVVTTLSVAVCAWDEPAKGSDRSDDLSHEEFFEAKVRPILVARCHSCHGAKKQEHGLRLDSRASVLAGSEEGEIVVAGKPGQSKLVAAIGYNGDIQMPPKAKLPDEEIAILTRWVKIGLPWPADQSTSESPKPLTGEELYRYSRQKLWSLQPIARRPLPAVNDRSWPRGALDVYVLAKLEAAGLSPAPEADRRTLIRRATFDLLGLPPTPEAAAAFLADDAPDAYERLIDRLLASPAYGERWGRHWLDVARYADTKGYAFGKERKFPFAFTYRDWVIDALNADMPYNEFVLQQMAADRLPENPARHHAALGLLTVGRQYDNEHDNIDDQIDVVTRGFLGMTVACARCHDHKYDAIPTADYYSLYGVFASSTRPKEYPLVATPAETAEHQRYQSGLRNRQQAFEAFKNAKHGLLLDDARRNVTEYLVRVVTKKPEGLLAKLPFISLNPEDLKPQLVTRWREYLNDHAKEEHPVFKAMALRDVDEAQFAEEAAKRIATWKDQTDGRFNPLVRQALIDHPPTTREELARIHGELLQGVYKKWKDAGAGDAARESLSPPEQQLLHELLGEGTPTNVPLDELKRYLIREDRNNYTKLEKEVQSHEANAPGAPARAMSLVDKAQLFAPKIFIRGNHHRRGDHVPRQFLRVVAGDDRQPFTQGSGRLEMARAIADPANPLTPRVIVNRVWMHHFGRPLVKTPSDFGMRSEPPAQLDLLDALASDLVENGWSLKQLHRTIMLSATYRQSSNNVGRSFTPSGRNAISSYERVDPENDLLWRMNRRRLEFEALRDAMLSVSGRLETKMYGRPVDIFTNIDSGRRGVYAFIDRQDLPNLLRAFDFASPDQSAARRPSTTVPQQALFMMNSPFVIEQAKAVIARPEVALQTEPPRRVEAVYRLLLTRKPTDDERTAAFDFITAAEANQTAADKLTPWQQYAQLMLLTNEFMFVD